MTQVKMRQKLGQHFLKNKEVLKREVAALEIKDGDLVIEIGPGKGALTRQLITNNQGQITNNLEIKIIGIEKDGGLAEKLRKDAQLRHNRNSIEIITGDVLEILPKITGGLKLGSYKLIGNIPYYLTGFLFRTIGELKNKPKVCVFIIQREVAERMVEKPPKMNKLAASVQFWAEVELLGRVSRRDFSPPPEVESALIKLDVRSKKLEIEEEKYYGMVNILFQQPRKTILNNLRHSIDIMEIRSRNDGNALDELSEKLKNIGIDPKSRPQDLEIGKIVKIAEGFIF